MIYIITEKRFWSIFWQGFPPHLNVLLTVEISATLVHIHIWYKERQQSNVTLTYWQQMQQSDLAECTSDTWKRKLFSHLENWTIIFTQMPPMLYCIVIVCCGPTEYEKRLRSDTHQTLIICCGAMDRIDSFLAFSRIFHPKWMKIICHATGARHIQWDLSRKPS